MDRFFRTAHTGEHRSLTNRRDFEESRLTLDDQLSISQKLVEHAEWQKRSDAIVRRNAITRYAKQTLAQQQQELERRRAALRLLLSEEEQRYKQEMLASLETQEQRAARVMNQARKLKTEREARSAAYAEAAYEKQWKESCDDLRTIDSHFFSLHCNDTVIEQMAEKQRKIQQQKQLAAEQDALWEQQRLDKVRQEELKQQQRQEAQRENRRALQQQMEEHQKLEQQQKEAEQKEKEIFVRQTTHKHCI